MIPLKKKITEFGVHSVYNLAKGYGVDTFSKGFDDMGGLTFNLLNVSTIARLLGADTETANNMSLGLFELQITTKGATSRFGTNGIDVSGMLYDLGNMFRNPQAFNPSTAGSSIATLSDSVNIHLSTTELNYWIRNQTPRR